MITGSKFVKPSSHSKLVITGSKFVNAKFTQQVGEQQVGDHRHQVGEQQVCEHQVHTASW